LSCNEKRGRREQGESSPGAKDEDTIWTHDRHHKSELPMMHNGRVILLIEQRCCEEQRMQHGGDGREPRNRVERLGRLQYSPRADLAAHSRSALTSPPGLAARQIPDSSAHSQPNPHSYGNSTDAPPHVDSEGGNT